MQRKGITEVFTILRYNSPSKTQIKRLSGRPKFLKEPCVPDPPIDYSKLAYQTKDVAPFAVFYGFEYAYLVDIPNISRK